MKNNLYFVKFSKVKNHILPPLLKDFSKWLSGQTYGSVGHFELICQEIPKQITEDGSLVKKAFAFISLPDGSLVVLQDNGQIKYLDSEGGRPSTIAKTLTEFLVFLSDGQTTVMDLDESSASGRENLKKWLQEKKLLKKTSAKTLAGNSKNVKYQDFESALGKTLNSKQVKELLKKLKAGPPRFHSDGYWTLPKEGINMIFETPKEAEVAKKKQEFWVLKCVQIYPKDPKNGIQVAYAGSLPGNLEFSDMKKDAHKKLGKPTSTKPMFGIEAWKNYHGYDLFVEYKDEEKTIGYVSMELK